MELLHQLTGWVLEWANSPYAVWLLLTLAFVEAFFFPVPPDVLMITLASVKPSLAIFYASITTIGSVAGGVFGYILGVKGGRPLLLKLCKPEKLRLAERLYHRFGSWAVGISAFSPIPYQIFTISAGAFSLNFRHFFLASILGRGGRFFLVGVSIFFFGPLAKEFIQNYLDVAAIGLTLALITGFLLVRLMIKKNSQEKEQDLPNENKDPS